MNERRTEGERFLKTVKDAWQDHQLCMGMLADVLMYMVRQIGKVQPNTNANDVQERVYCSDNRVPSIYTTALDLFRAQILNSDTGSPETGLDTVLMVLISVMLEQIQLEREGDIIDKSSIKACTWMLESLHKPDQETDEQRLYNIFFEPKFITASREFYRKEGERLLRDSDAGSYCRQTMRRINEEVDRCRSTLSESTTKQIEDVVVKELIQNKMQDLIEMESGVQFMIDNERMEDLEFMFELNARVDKEKVALTKAVQKRVVQLGDDINKPVAFAAQVPPSTSLGDTSTEKAKAGERRLAAVNQQTLAAIKWVEEVLLMKEKFDNIWKMAFKSDQALQTALTRSFTDFINSTTFNRGSEYISLFIDENMRKHIKTMTEDEVDQMLEKAITLLRYVQDKDLFERYYKKHLARRLLMDKSASLEIEKQMISKMKIELGNTFTAKLEGMFKDMTISDELTANYREHIVNLGAPDPTRIDLRVHVLTSMTWPIEMMESLNNPIDGTVRKVIYPPDIERLKQRFENFYSKKHSGRRLTWQPQMGTADLKARLPSKKAGREFQNFEYNVSTYAMFILLLFNDLPPGESLTFEEIQARTNILEVDLIRNLQSLAVANFTRILRKEPMSKDVKPTDKFYFNENFTPRALKIKVGVVLAANKVETDRERLETEKKNDGNRQYVIEAAIVRIMK